MKRTVKSKKGQRLPARHCYAVSRDPNSSVWMESPERCISAARAVAVDAMVAAGLDPNDFRMRDKIIMAISPRIDGMLEYASLGSCIRGDLQTALTWIEDSFPHDQEGCDVIVKPLRAKYDLA